ncbi:MAG: alpha/beta fold hydrolase [Desulfosalsimonas sp.]
MKTSFIRQKKFVFGCLVSGIILLAASAFTLYTIRTTLDNLISRTAGEEIESTTPADLGLPYTDIEFKSESGLRIQGWFIQGKTGNHIILGPGKGANRWDVLSYAPFLYQAGYSVLLFDPRSTGLSQGEKYGFGYFESRDMIQAANYLESNHVIENIGIIGFSAGGTAAILAALEDPRIKAVVADSAFASLEKAATGSMKGLRKVLFQAVLPIFRLEAEKKLGVEVFGELDLTGKIQNLEKPVFFIHGTRDQVILPANSRLLYSLAPGPKDLWFVSGAGHVHAFFHHPQAFKEKVLAFFDRNLRRQGGKKLLESPE